MRFEMHEGSSATTRGCSVTTVAAGGQCLWTEKNTASLHKCIYAMMCTRICGGSITLANVLYGGLKL